MKAYAFDFHNNRIHQYRSKAEATSAGNGRIIASTIEELAAERITGDQLVGLYNALTPDAQIKRFETKEKGIVRLWALAEAKAIVVDESTQERAPQGSSSEKKEKSMPKKEKVKKAEAAETSGKRGRVSEFAGKKLIANVEGNENPRREGSYGHTSMQIIIDAGKKGIVYEDFLAAGGRRTDLAFDFNKGYVTVQ